MHVPGNSVPRFSRPPFAAAVVAMFASAVGVANAVEFDEKVKAPQSRDAAELRSRAQAYFGHAALKRSGGIDAVIRDRGLAQERFDVTWDLQRSIDFGKPIGDMSAEGVVDRGDGTYGVDLTANPQWSDPADRLAGLLPVLDRAALGTEFKRRGMSAEGLGNLNRYLDAHDVNEATRQAALPVAISFSRVVRKFDKIRRPVPDSLVFSYLYQRELATGEARRQWGVGLLDALGPADTRIVESYLDEMKSTVVWAPSDSRSGIDTMLATLRLADFEQKATAEAKGVKP